MISTPTKVKFRFSLIWSRGANEASYPAGYLGDILLHFPHDKDFADAAAKWARRTARINYDEIIVLVSAGKILTEQGREYFHEIKVINKCLYVPDERSLLPNEFSIPEYGLLDDGVDILDINPKTGLKYYEYLDCTTFINDGTIKRHHVKFFHYISAFIRTLFGGKPQK